MVGSDHRELPEFERKFFGTEQTFTRIGSGELGGKGAGLDRIRREILSQVDPSEFPEIEIVVPTLTVLTTEIFDLFMERNDLRETAQSDLPNDRIAHAFQQGNFPAEYVGDLRALIGDIHTPLAVRSSSLLEDALSHPFAGVYGTKMIPNNEIDIDTRFRKLMEAVKFVYASTFFRSAKEYILSVGKDLADEKMAVIIQEVVGNRHGDRFYPRISGVARSYNYYPYGHAGPDDGVVNLALGLGCQIVDGGLSWAYSPAYPKAPAPFNDVGDILRNTQKGFWAINMGKPPLPDPIHETEYLIQAELADAEAEGSLVHLASTYDPGSNRIRPGIGAKGPRVLNFHPILSSGVLPLNDALKRLLDLTEEAEGEAVEIEFAVTMDGYPKQPARLGFLQARPMMVSADEIDLDPAELEGEGVLVASDQVMGNGCYTDIEDVIFLKPDVFEAKHTRKIGAELASLNRAIVKEGRQYLLMGFGRWGSSDPWLGVPIDWAQINGARVIVEATLPDMITDMSQGSHFFHNVISFKVLYLSVRYSGPYPIDWEWLQARETVAETTFVRHVRLPAPLTVKVDGKGGRGVIRRDD